jgi:hypothetical protein
MCRCCIGRDFALHRSYPQLPYEQNTTVPKGNGLGEVGGSAGRGPPHENATSPFELRLVEYLAHPGLSMLVLAREYDKSLRSIYMKAYPRFSRAFYF